MVASDIAELITQAGATLFPGYREKPVGSRLMGLSVYESPLGPFTILGPTHTSFAAEWPIRVDVPASIRGFRRALGLSQAKFATRIKQSRLNIERWEGGKSRPFRGHILTLLGLLRPHVEGEVAAGQLLNLAAAAVCPIMTRPAAIYTGHELAAPLADRRNDHTDLLPALLGALIYTEVLVALESDEDNLDSRYVPLVGANLGKDQNQSWEAEVRVVARRLAAEDRRLWLAMGRRLGRP